MIYADNAATTRLDQEAFAAMLPWLQDEYGNASQPYFFGRKARKAMLEARAIIAQCINALPEEIYFTSGGTESDNWAIKGTMLCGDYRSIITSQIEHHAILNTCAAIERLGYPVMYLTVDRKGVVISNELQKMITDRTKLVSIMMANNEIGTIEPISDLVKIAHKHGALFHTDAVQAVGHIPIDVKDLNVDMLSASAHKFNGPKGVGFLYIKKGTKILPFSDGGSQENGMRAGTENIASIIAMAVALRKNYEQMQATALKLKQIEDVFLKKLTTSKIKFIRNGDENHIPGNVNISIQRASGEMFLHRLDLKGICISTGSACDSVNTQISHVIKAIGAPEEYARGTIRISFGRDNTLEEAEKIANAIISLLQ